MNNEDGSTTNGYIFGNIVTGDEESVDLSQSILPKGVNEAAGIHSHPNGIQAEEFSPYWNPGDKQVAYNVEGSLYRATPKRVLKEYDTKNNNERGVNITLLRYYKYTSKCRK